MQVQSLHGHLRANRKLSEALGLGAGLGPLERPASSSRTLTDASTLDGLTLADSTKATVIEAAKVRCLVHQCL